VDEKLIQLCPIAIEKLPVIYEQLSTNKEIIFSQIASTCRQIILDVADALFPPQKTKKSDKTSPKLDSGKPINRILAAIKKQGKTEAEFFDSMFDYVDNFLHSLQTYTSSGTHKGSIQKSDAIRCVIYTYFLLGDILHYYFKNSH